MSLIDQLDREELSSLTRAYAFSWLAHDGCWFLAAEDAYGMDRAIDLDRESWRRFGPIEATRIARCRNLPPDGGLDALQEALSLRMYAWINELDLAHNLVNAVK